MAELPVTQHLPQHAAILPRPRRRRARYLPGHEERKVLTHLVGERAAELNDLLTQGGFRRSQSIAYRPACEQLPGVRLGAGHRRCLPADAQHAPRSCERNGDLVGDMRAAVPTSEQYSVFRAYLDSRHRDGGMADMTVLDYAMMVEDSHVETRMIEYRRRGPDSSFNGRGTGELLAVALSDVLADGLSMVYSFFGLIRPTARPAHS